MNKNSVLREFSVSFLGKKNTNLEPITAKFCCNLSQFGGWSCCVIPVHNNGKVSAIIELLPSYVFSAKHVLCRVVNETLESISLDLGFSGSTLAEGLVVSTCLGGAFVGSLFSGLIADGIGHRRALHLCALPMIIGASVSATTRSLWGMLLGRLFVGSGMDIGPTIASLYVAALHLYEQVSPAFVRGTFGRFTQITTCLGLLGALFIGIPAKDIVGWWWICFWVSAIPAALLAVFMEFCAESPHL